MEMVFTRMTDPDGNAVWFVTTEISQINKNYLDARAQAGEEVSTVTFKNGTHVIVQGSPDDVIRLIMSEAEADGSGSDAE